MLINTNNADWQTLAQQRVDSCKELSPYNSIIFYESWADWDEHLEWVATAPTAEIVSWAAGIDACDRD